MILRINSALLSTVKQEKFAKAKKGAHANCISFLLSKTFFLILLLFVFVFMETSPRDEIKFSFLLYVIKKRKSQFSPATQSLIQPLLQGSI